MEIRERGREQSLKTPEAYRSFFEGKGDEKAFFFVESLRKEVESLHGWNSTKEKAKREIGKLPDNIIPEIVSKLKPYLELMPAGHSKGHAYRDFISAMIALKDPEIDKIDDVEKIVGVLAGTFHDIGNAVIKRYEEPKRFSGHAEVGAYLFGELAKDIIPPNLLKLTQYAIAAHTHYTKDISVTKKINGREETLVRRPYEDELIEGSRMGIWLARMTDRVDAQGVQMIIRHSLTKAEPTYDYDPQTGFHEVKEDNLEDFKHQFTPVLRADEYRNGLSGQDKTRNVLEHMKMFRDSALEKSDYSKNDSRYFRETFIVPAASEQMEFVEAVLAQTPALKPEDIQVSFARFYDFCRLIEPSKNTEEVIELFKKKFSSFNQEQQSHWANGFNVLPNLYRRWYKRTELKLVDGFSANLTSKTKKILDNGNSLAAEKLKDFKLV